jgi:CheY-like chemotaxis protein
MTTPIESLLMAAPIPSTTKKKRVLLVDASPKKRDLRAEIMRKLGIEVDCAADISEARSWWRADLYSLVLLHVENEMGRRDKFCEDVRGATPPQQLAFLVGKPEYLAHSPSVDDFPSLNNAAEVLQEDVKTNFSIDLSSAPQQRWGILEASRRISAVRSASTARTKAIRDRPEPPRDLEKQDAKRNAAWSHVLPELQKEEMQ